MCGHWEGKKWVSGWGVGGKIGGALGLRASSPQKSLQNEGQRSCLLGINQQARVKTPSDQAAEAPGS